MRPGTVVAHDRPDPTVPEPARLGGAVVATVATGLVVATLVSAHGSAVRGVPGASVVVAAVGGMTLVLAVTALAARARSAVVGGALGAGLAIAVAVVLLRLDVAAPVVVALAGGAALTVALRSRSRAGAVTAAVASTLGLTLAAAPVADAWEVKTHVMVIDQAAVILRADGRVDVADFLASSAPAPLDAVAAAGTTKGGGQPTTYQGWVDQGAHDADHRVKKTLAPDHFFNWWTRSGKGLVAGGSAATSAEEQFDDAVRLWRAGDRAGSMFHLGVATHLVGDACTPPHQFFLVPSHREFEQFIVSRQGDLAVASGGIYQADLAGAAVRGGADWSSQHTRGWVDECSRRGVGYTIAATQASSPTSRVAIPALSAGAQIEDAQRLSAGYLAFFFDTVGGP